MSKKRTTLRNKLDKQWSLAIRSKGACEVCGKSERLNAHHFYSRSALSTRWDLDNGFCLCVGCHTFSSKFSAHKTPADFVEWAIETRGKEWYENLRKKHRFHNRISDVELEEMLIELKGMNNE